MDKKISAKSGKPETVTGIRKENSVIGIHGKKGSGKTLFCIRHIIPLFKRILIIDGQGDYEYTICENIRTLKTALEQNHEKEYFAINYRPFDYNTDGFFKLAEKIVNVTIVVDEIGRYSSPYYINPDLEKIAQYGRHYRQSLIYLSRRPAETNRNITAQVDTIISFRQIEPIDLKYFREIMLNSERLTELKRYVYPEPIKEDSHYIIVSGKQEFEKLKSSVDK